MSEKELDYEIENRELEVRLEKSQELVRDLTVELDTSKYNAEILGIIFNLSLSPMVRTLIELINNGHLNAAAVHASAVKESMSEVSSKIKLLNGSTDQKDDDSEEDEGIE